MSDETSHNNEIPCLPTATVYPHLFISLKMRILQMFLILIFKLFNKVYKLLALVYQSIVNSFLILTLSFHICGYTVAANRQVGF
ncbi:MAG: hypothetical protein V3V33_05680 [Candidatus Lokiarchaeia archaeon]